MIATLFGSRSIEKILLFLFVNEKTYGTQLQKVLNTPLTPIQRALNRLEKSEVLISHFEGKLKIYELNPAFALRVELEALLKKHYTLLSCAEKKQYCFIDSLNLQCLEKGKKRKERRKELLSFWEVLLKMQKLSLFSKSRLDHKVLTKTGKATIHFSLTAPFILTSQEKGHWFLNEEPKMGFTSSFRWTLDLKNTLITIEHLRYGEKSPIFLFHLTVTQTGKLQSVDAHLCGDDTYLGQIVWDLEQIIFRWRIIGPKKNDELIYHYR